MPYFAHPNEKLQDHLKLVGQELQKLAQNKLEQDVFYLIGLAHDFGKYTEIFQYKLLDKDYLENSKKLKSLTNLERGNLLGEFSDHSQLGALFFMFVWGNLNFQDKNYFLAGINAIFKHHQALSNLDYLKSNDFWQKTLKIVKTQINYLNSDIETEIKDLVNFDFDLEEFKIFINNLETKYLTAFFTKNFNLSCENSFLIKKVYSNLLYADKYKTIFKNKEKKQIQNLDANLIDKYRQENGFNEANSSFNKLRNDFYKQVDESLKNFDLSKNFLILNGPTGIGKTLNLLNIGFKLQDKLENAKIVYALPFTSIIDQTEEVLKDILQENYSQLVFKHHYLSAFEDWDDKNYNENKFLLNAWDKKIILTTFWQVFHTIFKNANKLNIKFSNFQNTIFLLDEIQSIPYKYWAVIGKMMKILSEKYNCYFVLSSATLPKFIESEDSFNLVPNYKNFFTKLNRTKLNLTSFDKLSFDELENLVYPKISGNKSYLLVFNTIKSSIEFYNRLKNQNFNQKIYYLSTNIIPKHRKKIIQKVKTQNNQILVSTQLIEAGVDIDFDVAFRDFAPIDSIVQVLGRLNRNAKKQIGELFLFKLKDENNVFEKEYSSYIYNFFVRNISNEILKNKKIIEEKDYLHVFEKYFDYILKNSSQTLSDNLWKYFCNADFTSLAENFNLIENQFETIDIFVDLDENSAKIWEKYEKILQIKDIWERKKAWDKLKKDFLSYTIQVSVENTIKVGLLSEDWKSKQEYKRGIVYLGKDRLDSYYDLETGFKFETDDFI